ncbi:MAG: DUF948 domain-containing protein [Nitrospiraceae bacterium]|nr:DUF948 domain-containing protein [Nitrospiraceae bacterium]
MSQTEIMIFIGIGFLIVFGLLLYVLYELRRVAKMVTGFIKVTEDTIKPALEEFQQTMKSLRKITDDINALTGDARSITGGLRNIGHSIRSIVEVVNEATAGASLKVLGLRAGIKSTIVYLFKNIFLRKGD